jgi:hypothetical protein
VNFFESTARIIGEFPTKDMIEIEKTKAQVEFQINKNSF